MYTSELRFLQRLLNHLGIPFFVTPVDSAVLPALDMGLRSAVGSDREAFSEWSERMRRLLREKVIFYISDEFHCHYAALLLPGGMEVLMVGPYLTEQVDHGWLQGFARETGLDDSWLPVLENYYQRLRAVDSEFMLFAALQALAEHLWGVGQYTTERLERGIPESWQPLSADPKAVEGVMDRLRLIESRYESENRLMELVRQGRTQMAQMTLAHFSSAAMERRVGTARDMKNYSIILSTLMRKAVEQSGVHPMYIDRVSSDFAVRIEAVSDWENMRSLWQEMARGYCLLVKKHRTAAYSPLVQKVIARIDMELAADLSLRATAETMNVNASYLSALFKRETGETLTDFVARRRMEHGAYLLGNTTLSVSAVAQSCGISDDNYFAKLFKRHTGLPPSRFRQEQRFAGKK